MTTFALPADIRIHEVAGLKLALPDPRGTSGAVHLDASAVTDIDLAGVQLLLAWSRAVRSGGSHVRLERPSSVVVDALHLLGLGPEFGLSRTPGEAS